MDQNHKLNRIQMNGHAIPKQNKKLKLTCNISRWKKQT